MSKFIKITICTIAMTFTFSISQAKESVCYGTTKQGRLEGGVQLPNKGNNFESYSTLARWLGRTYVHSKVRDVMLEAYQILEAEQPEKVFKYAEIGHKSGGDFKPHKTHQNGLSVDFIVPVVNKNGVPSLLSTNVLNKYGYAIEFDGNGKYKDYRLDFDAVGAHIVALHKSALNNGIDIWRVIFDPGLQPHLYATQYGSYIKKNIKIPTKKSWVRHDDHYHVDFAVECKPMK